MYGVKTIKLTPKQAATFLRLYNDGGEKRMSPVAWLVDWGVRKVLADQFGLSGACSWWMGISPWTAP